MSRPRASAADKARMRARVTARVSVKERACIEERGRATVQEISKKIGRHGEYTDRRAIDRAIKLEYRKLKADCHAVFTCKCVIRTDTTKRFHQEIQKMGRAAKRKEMRKGASAQARKSRQQTD
eukprot:6210743-Pleurochrysis_carterae.AAC.3